jgi:hypothetical protein
MSKRRFTKEEITDVLKNKNVARCSEKSISYSKDFMIHAVKRYGEGYPAVLIFKEAGFNIGLVGRKTPKNCIGAWNKIYRTKGEDGLKIETRGRGKGGGRLKKVRDLTDADKIKRLEAEVAYLKAENDFFKQLRAK